MTRRYGASYWSADSRSTGLSIDASGDWSVCGWVYPATLVVAGGDLCFLSDAGGNNAFHAYIGWGFNGGNPVLRLTCGDGTTRVLNRYHNIAGALNQWYHLALVHNNAANTVTAYVNGVQVEQQSIAISAFNFVYAEFGDFASGNDIEIAQVKLWGGYALSVGELADEIDYWTPQHGTGNVEGWWQFDNAAQLVDSSGNGYDLTNVYTTDGRPAAGSQTVPGQLEPSGGTTHVGAGTMTATASLSGSAGEVFTAAGAISCTASLSGSAGEVFVAAGTLSATATLSGGGQKVRPGAGTLSATATLSGAAARIHGAAGALSANLTMTGAALSIFSAAGTLSATFTFAGAADVSSPTFEGWCDPPLGAATAHGPWVPASA